MKPIKPAIAFIAGGVALLTVGGGTAYAANGGSFLLGRSNTATVTTTLTNAAGVPLRLNAKAGYPPLVVNSNRTVTNLNADRLDGLDGAAMALAGGRTAVVFGTTTDADKLPFTARCPAGTVATGGGGVSSAAAVPLSYSGPDFVETTGALIPNSWAVFETGDGSGAAWVVCYNPRGAVSGAATTFAGSAPAGSPVQLKRAMTARR